MLSFDRVLLCELISIIKPIREYYNSSSALVDAIMDHKIQYVNGMFVGKFNAKISKELVDLGAKFDKRKGGFVIDRMKLPSNVRHAVAVASLATMTMYKKVLQLLESFNPSTLVSTLNEELDIPLDEILEDLDDQKRRTVEDAIKIKVRFSPAEKQRLKQVYTDDMNKAVKSFADNQIVKLRQLVEKSLFEGLGDKALLDAITKQFNVTKNKAAFLARQETGLLISTYRQITYGRVGITKYKWSTSHDERVRAMHKDLDGKIFEFNSPPVTNEKGDHNNPGEDWQCRCTPIPVFEDVVYLK